ncbi:hypothetical protein KX928_13015 [Roseobacter sp. YSTF-M11]|uniref:Uncharacterized protein n=1 Tax=Roseobacter insulae TaxID=2859783 RepID=A0A9X1K2N1_9RHOB|nr:hypothetical protein [Roseobacter insulae]MBW4708703.1 hypothetical protein [Roseobacter insulae]
MIGVVLWSDASDRKAVIWCEDQGDLAFLNSAGDTLQSDAFFDAGDVVQFDMEVHASMRRAHNPRLVLERAGADLPDVLLRGVSPSEDAPRSAQIIPFAPREQDATTVYQRVSEA